MKKVLLLTMLLLASLGMTSFAHSHGTKKHSHGFRLKKGEKKAILLVSFGTTFKETRAKTLDALEKDFKTTYPDFKVETALTSRIVMRRIKEKEGISYNNPTEALEKLKKEGYTHVLVQGTHVMNGIEAETLEKEVAKQEKNFKVIRVGAPLLTEVDDYEDVVEALKPTYANLKSDEATVFIGHGTPHHANSSYSMLENVFHQEDADNVYLGTVEGYPEIDHIIKTLKKANIKKVNLYPFMIVAGDHAKNDIAGDMKEELEEKGFIVESHMIGLGENKDIRKIYLAHAKDAMNHVEEDMIAKKKDYAKGKESNHHHHH